MGVLHRIRHTAVEGVENSHKAVEAGEVVGSHSSGEEVLRNLVEDSSSAGVGTAVVVGHNLRDTQILDSQTSLFESIDQGQEWQISIWLWSARRRRAFPRAGEGSC